MVDETRRGFLADSGKLIAATALGGVSGAALGEEMSHHGGSGDGLSVSAEAEKTCATCRFWGGMRRVSDDKTQVVTQSMGWCNNPDSPNHTKLTAADHEMLKPGIWEKWSVL
jgi:hypothetical protein